MITVTTRAAEQIRQAARQGHLEGMPLRLAAIQQPDGQIQYAMGFADDQREDDLHFISEGIQIVVAPNSIELLRNTEIDFAELDNGESQFIFKNPNDPVYQRADGDDKSG